MMSKQYSVVLVDGTPLLYPADMNRLESTCDVRTFKQNPKNAEELIIRGQNADIVIVFLTELDAAFFAACPTLKMVLCASTGYENVDLETAQKNGVTVCFLPDYATRAVAEYTIGLIVATARRIFMASCDVRDGCSYQHKYIGKQLRGKTLGVLGCGRIGTMVAEMAEAGLSMKILKYDKDCNEEDLDKLLSSSDVISIHLPLTPDTYHFLGDLEMNKMKDEVIIINTSRGGIIEEDALLKHLESGKVFAAGLDVLEIEPPPLSNPLLAFPNVLITPHIAYNADGALGNRSRKIVEAINAFLDGKPVGQVGS